MLPNPIHENISEGSEISRRYVMVGKLIGKSLCSRVMLGIKMAGPFLNLLINRKNSYE